MFNTLMRSIERRRQEREHGHRFFSQEGEDMILRRSFESLGRSGFYVDVGAHHPMRFSNTYHFYRQGWRGINIEPNPEVIELFDRLRERDINLQLGIARQAGELVYQQFNEPALNSFDAAFATRIEAEGKGYRVVRRVPVAVRPLATVLAEHLPTGIGIDFMSVDVEGLDLEVLQSNNWSRFRPGFLIVECHGFELERAVEFPTHQYLSEQGYGLHAKCVHSLIYRQRDGG